MKIKTSKDVRSSLAGSAFRKAVCDGRSWNVRETMTMRRLRCRGEQGGQIFPNGDRVNG